METVCMICFSVICGIIISFLLFCIYTEIFENKFRVENKKLVKQIEKLESELAIRDEYISSKRRNK